MQSRPLIKSMFASPAASTFTPVSSPFSRKLGFVRGNMCSRAAKYTLGTTSEGLWHVVSHRIFNAGPTTTCSYNFPFHTSLSYFCLLFTLLRRSICSPAFYVLSFCTLCASVCFFFYFYSFHSSVISFRFFFLSLAFSSSYYR